MRANAVFFCLLTFAVMASRAHSLAMATEPRVPNPAAQPSTVDASIAERVLIAESRGDLTERSRLVLDLVGGQEAAALGQSLTGNLRERDGWKSIEESIDQHRQSRSLDKYENYRREQPDTIDGHVNLAQWCGRASLDEQQAAHWQHVLQLDSSNQLARLALGHRMVDGVWVSPEEVAVIRQRVSDLRTSLGQHGKRLMQLYAAMLMDREKQRETAIGEFLAIDDAAAIPAVGAIFATAPEPLVDYAIQWLRDQQHPAAAELLVRWSVEHPMEATRELCIEALNGRPYHQYVPLLLDRTGTRLVSAVVPTFRQDGSLAGVRHVFARERREDVQVTVVDSMDVQQFRGTPVPQGTANSTPLQRQVARAVQQQRNEVANAQSEMQFRAAALRTAMQNEQIAAAENMTTETVNDRVRRVLARTAGTNPEAPLMELWDWWATYTEREPAAIKLASYTYRMNLSQSTVYATPRSTECFVAGTLVTTSRGQRPIESLAVGDRVLSKNIETGELVWDGVIDTTEQPAKPLVTVTAGRDEMQCTGGHLFWVSGRGWIKARDLKQGDLLHAAACPAVVIQVVESQPQPTYNLITARYRNYFVGAGRLLSHDFTEQEPTAVRVPGLSYALGR